MVEAGRSDVDELRRALESAQVPHLEAAGEIELANLPAHSLDDLGAAMTGIDAPQPGRSIDHAAAVVRGESGAFGSHKEARRLFVLAVRRERHPECFEIVGGEPCAHGSA